MSSTLNTSQNTADDKSYTYTTMSPALSDAYARAQRDVPELFPYTAPLLSPGLTAQGDPEAHTSYEVQSQEPAPGGVDT